MWYFQIINSPQKRNLPGLKLKRVREKGLGLCIIGYMYNIIHFPFPHFFLSSFSFSFSLFIAVSYLPVCLHVYLPDHISFGLF